MYHFCFYSLFEWRKVGKDDVAKPITFHREGQAYVTHTFNVISLTSSFEKLEKLAG